LGDAAGKWTEARVYAESGVAPELIVKVMKGARLLGLPD